MYRRADPLALEPLGPIGIGRFQRAYAAASALALDPLSPIPTHERHHMKIVVIGGSGLIGSKLVRGW